MACPRPGPAIGKARGSLPRPQISELKGPLKAAFWICSFTSHFQVRTRGLAPPPRMWVHPQDGSQIPPCALHRAVPRCWCPWITMMS